ncbi:hypothetical protein SAMN05216360_103173 [Methylobacterium phyllostachyos]|uniref:Uncharacterized protein n=1 Tax=Methylobacterium phyllostachyos TaxID=582672 RepID=A0A1G9VGF4_9HYPH|nr:DUF1178 family protein [Methylobacterium phyllostachyos]SDM70905.1 hypothetical protein SAMN05216360_103173 [Methylobacterium phyllostachyos]
MIRYSLVCEAGHGFESWFPSSDSFDTQVAGGLVTCPICNSASVGKALMVPSIARGKPTPAASPAPPDTPTTLIAEPERQLRTMLRALRDHMVASAEHVGARFPEEARKIHYGEAEGRAIYGEASPAEARALVEEGIEVAAIPVLPDDCN